MFKEVKIPLEKSHLSRENRHLTFVFVTGGAKSLHKSKQAVCSEQLSTRGSNQFVWKTLVAGSKACCHKNWRLLSFFCTFRVTTFCFRAQPAPVPIHSANARGLSLATATLECLQHSAEAIFPQNRMRGARHSHSKGVCLLGVRCTKWLSHASPLLWCKSDWSRVARFWPELQTQDRVGVCTHDL